MKYLKISLVIFIFTLLGFETFSPIDSYLSRLKIVEVSSYPEKTYLHTDKPFYTSDDTIWFKNYLINGITHKQTKKSNVVYVELINPEDSIVFKEKFYIQDNTYGAPGDIVINPKWKTGTYQLRSYTNYMRNQGEKYFFRKSVPIEQVDKVEKKLELVVNTLDTEKDTPIEHINLVFYPEGGKAVANFQNKFGIKATDKKGNGVKVLGAIKEKGKNEIIKMFRTFDFGLGYTDFIPKENVEYIAEIQLNGRKKQYKLDKVTSEGIKLSVLTKKESISVSIEANQEKLKDYFLIAHLRGKLLFNKTFKKNENQTSIKLITNDLPNGIVHFTVFDPQGRPRAERLVYIDNSGNGSTAKIIVNKKKFKKREQVSYNLDVVDKQGKKKNASISLSVTQKASVPLSIKENIKSWFLLNSDLRGQVPNAAVFFDPNKTVQERKYLLESLMLTHGWRRFKWEDYKNPIREKKFIEEKGLNISGRLVALDKATRGKKVETTLMIVDKVPRTQTQVVNPNGKFNFGPIVVKDTLKVVLQAKAQGVKENKQKEIKFILDRELESPEVTPLPKINIDKENLFFKNYVKNKNYINQINFTINGANTLDETIIKGKSRRSVADQIDEYISSFPNSYYGEPSSRIILDSIASRETLTMENLLRRVPGVRVQNNGDGLGGLKITIRGTSTFLLSTDPLILLDGNEVPIDQISFLTGGEISIVDVLKGNDAAIFGSRGVNGVIAIYTRADYGKGGSKEKPGIFSFTTSSFYKEREFYSKKYFSESQKNDISPDYRTTLHWNPNANALANNVVSTIFYTGDQTGVFQFEVEGITEDGELIYQIADIEVVE